MLKTRNSCQYYKVFHISYQLAKACQQGDNGHDEKTVIGLCIWTHNVRYITMIEH